MTDTNEPKNPYAAPNDNRWGDQGSVPPVPPVPPLSFEKQQYAQPAVSPPYVQQDPNAYPPYNQSPYGYQQPYVGGYPTQPRNQLALVSMITGIVGFFFGLLASIAAIITGHMALNQLKINPAQEGRGMAIAGLILGYLVTAGTILFFLLFLGLGLAAGGLDSAEY